MLLAQFLPAASADTLLPLMADAVAKATLLLAFGGVAAFLLRRASAAVRHLAWTLALVGALALPALSLAMPRWHLPLIPLAAFDVREPVRAPIAAGASGAAATDTAVSPGGFGSGPARREAKAPPAPSSPGPFRSISWFQALVLIWIVGAVSMLARLALGFVAVSWMSRRTERVTGARWLPLARELSAGLGITSRILFLRSAGATMPMAWGILRPAVLLPAGADDWPVERLRIVLLHELAHVKRRDCLTHLVAQVACALYWFNPLAWIAARRARAERERACDDLVLAAGTPGPDYADQLLDIARVMRAGRFPGVLAGASLAMARRSQLEGRLMAILDPTVPRAGISRMRAAAATGLFALAMVPLASLQPWAGGAAPAASASGDAVVPVTLEQAQPRPMPRPGPAPKPGAAAAPDATFDVAGLVHDVVPGAIRDALGGATQGMADGAAEGIAQGVAQGIAGGVSVNPNWNININTNTNTNINTNANAGQGEGRKAADPKVVAALTAAMKDSDKDVREAAMQALVQMRDPSIYEPMVAALGDASPDVREKAAFALGQLRDKRATAPLTAAMKDTSAAVREQVAFALGQLRDPAAVEGLIAALRDEIADVREQAAFALGQLRDPRAVDPLVAALKDADADVREQAAFALGQLRDPGAVEALVIALKDDTPSVREQAAFALGQLRDPRAIDGLTAALGDASADVRQQAAFALGQIAR